MNQTDKIRLMGIINATPDSFSGDGTLASDKIVTQADEFLSCGADILDIGGESTRPNAEAVAEDEELARVIPAIEAIIKNFPEAVISVDTYKAKVAYEALQAGASLVNDVTGLQGDDNMAKIVASANVPVILMHNRANKFAVTGQSYDGHEYADVVQDVKTALSNLADNAIKHGIAADNIILDSGIGFGKTAQQNMQLIKHSAELKSLGYPVLLGASRKSFIGTVLDRDEPSDRLAGSVACAAMAILTNGADIIRAHDVKFMGDFLKMLQAIGLSDG